MFDLGWSELFVIALVALVVLGPQELPGAIRTVTGLIRKARGLAREFHRSLDEMARESGLQEVKRDLEKATRAELDDDTKGLLSDPFLEGNKSILPPKTAAKPEPPSRPADAPATAAGGKDEPAPDENPKGVEPVKAASSTADGNSGA